MGSAASLESAVRTKGRVTRAGGKSTMTSRTHDSRIISADGSDGLLSIDGIIPAWA